MKTEILKARLKTSGIHFFLSALAFLIILYFIVIHWYPRPHFSINGGWQGVRIMLFVDIVLGPLLTLLIFNPGKSRRAILFDFTVIGIIQVSALIWGLSAVYSQRPVAISFWDGRFYSVLAKDLEVNNVTQENLSELSRKSPAIVYVRQPETDDEKTGVFTYGLVEGMLEYQIFFLYSSIDKHIDELFEASLDNLSNTNDAFQSSKDLWLEKSRANEQNLTFVPFEARYGNSILVLNREGEVIDSFTSN